jgi:hypothetical protein
MHVVLAVGRNFLHRVPTALTKVVPLLAEENHSFCCTSNIKINQTFTILSIFMMFALSSVKGNSSKTE